MGVPVCVGHLLFLSVPGVVSRWSDLSLGFPVRLVVVVRLRIVLALSPGGGRHRLAQPQPRRTAGSPLGRLQLTNSQIGQRLFISLYVSSKPTWPTFLPSHVSAPASTSSAIQAATTVDTTLVWRVQVRVQTKLPGEGVFLGVGGLAGLPGQEATGNSRASKGASAVCCFGSSVFSVTVTST